MVTAAPGATLVDGTGAPPARPTSRVEGDRIVAVGPPGELGPGRRRRGRRPRRPRPRPRLHRRPHPLRRPDPVGRRPHAVELARGDQRGHGQLRLRRGADPARHRDLIVRTLENVEGMSIDALLEAGHRLVLRDVPRVPGAIDERRSASTSAPSSATRRSACSWWAARSGRRPPTRSPRCGASCARRWRPAPSASRPRASRRTRGLRPAGAQPLRRGRRGPRLAACSARWARASSRCRSGPGLFVDQFSELAVRNGLPVTWTALLPGPTSPAPPCAPSSGARPCPARCTPRSPAGRSSCRSA